MSVTSKYLGFIRTEIVIKASWVNKINHGGRVVRREGPK